MTEQKKQPVKSEPEKPESPNPPASKEPKLKTEPPSEPGQGIKPGETKNIDAPGFEEAPGSSNTSTTTTGSKE